VTPILWRRLHGILAPIPTTFDDAGDVDRQGIEANVRQWSATSLAGLLALGSNGEAALLSEDEGDSVIAAVRAALPSGKVLLAGVGRESTRATARAAARAADLGADAVLVRTPSAFRPQMTADALVAHFTAVADASPVPVLLYNLPGATGLSLTLPMVVALARHPNIVGMKETSADLERLGQFAAVDQEGFTVLSGWAPVIYPALAAGAAGGILAVANVVPDLCAALFDHAAAGRHLEARQLQRELTPLAQLVTTGHGIAGLKFALDQVGFRGGPVRPPLQAATPAARDAIAAELARLNTSTRTTRATHH
jgi:4-hydroxy-2-oxoglutarate aldolase